MTERIDYIETIKSLLNRKGINDRKTASTIASILNIHYNSAKQKIDGKRGISLDEVKSIFKYFNEEFIKQREHNCVFIINNIHKRCNIQISSTSTIGYKDIIEDGSYAVNKDGIYIIDTKNSSSNDDLFKIKTINFLPEPKIAILDNDTDILELLKKITNRYGIICDTFTTIADLEKSNELLNYEAFILDWLLDYNDTPEKIIKKIREMQSSQSLIIILTGEVNHHEKIISEMIIDHHINLIEKPTKPLILSSLLLSRLFFN